MQELHAALLALQETDEQIASAQARIEEFAPQLEELEAPVTQATRELEATRAKLDELRTELHRLEKNATQKRQRLETQEEKLMKVRNAREEAAARAELDLVRRALNADLADLKQLSEQATRTDLKVDDVQRQVDRVTAEIAARRAELMAARGEVETELAQLQQRRENQAVRLDQPSRRLYERVRGGRSRTVLAPLTDEGACGNCFSVLPVQEQTLVRRGEMLHRCEGCGVILYSP
jgi:predicted  nucleic acid-binding Zn-ribbon protein